MLLLLELNVNTASETLFIQSLNKYLLNVNNVKHHVLSKTSGKEIHMICFHSCVFFLTEDIFMHKLKYAWEGPTGNYS